MAGGELFLPPGFRFHPTDEELVTHYLCRRCTAQPVPVPIIAEVDLYKYDPWQLPAMALYGEKEWYFFSPRDRKYPNGSRPNRAAGTGYWKATGADKPIGSPRPAAIKKALVFYSGKPPKGEKTNWIMHEYRLADVDRSARKKNHTIRLDEWVLCRIYHKNGKLGKQANPSRKPGSARIPRLAEPKREELVIGPQSLAPPASEMICFDSSESLPRLLGESSSSENALSSLDQLTCEREVESQHRWGAWCDDLMDDLGLGIVDDGEPSAGDSFASIFFRESSFQDLLMALQ